MPTRIMALLRMLSDATCPRMRWEANIPYLDRILEEEMSKAEDYQSGLWFAGSKAKEIESEISQPAAKLLLEACKDVFNRICAGEGRSDFDRKELAETLRAAIKAAQEE